MNLCAHNRILETFDFGVNNPVHFGEIGVQPVTVSAEWLVPRNLGLKDTIPSGFLNGAVSIFSNRSLRQAGSPSYFFVASAARQRYHAAVVRCGRQRSPNANNSFTAGRSRFL